MIGKYLTTLTVSLSAIFAFQAPLHSQQLLLQSWAFNDDPGTPPSEAAVGVPTGPVFSEDGNGHLTTGSALQIQRAGTPANSQVLGLNIPAADQHLRLEINFAGWHFETSETNRRSLTIGFLTSTGTQTAEFELRPSEEMALRAVAFAAAGGATAQPLAGVPLWGLTQTDPVSIRLDYNGPANTYSVSYNEGSGWITHFDGFTDPSRGADRIRVGAFVDYGETEYFHIDSMSFYAIPEPSTYALFAGMGILGLALWRRRRKQAAA